MKTLRLCLLLVLAALLPIRGAVAAAMLCPPMGAPVQAAEQRHVHHEGHHAQMQAEHQAHGGHHGHHSNTSDGNGSCNLCAAFCSLTPLLSMLPTMAPPEQLSDVSFPTLAAPEPSFVSGGQDRPPRTI